MVFIELDRVSHFFARDKLTYASVAGREHAVDYSIAELEHKLDPARFFRIHRSTLVNLDYIRELHAWFGGRALVRLRDEGKTELPVSRDRVRPLRKRMGF